MYSMVDRQFSSNMDARDRSVLDRHLPRLKQCLEPAKLLRYLERFSIFDEDDVELVREEKIKTSRENQVETFVDILKRREHGFRYLLKALLTSKVQDFLARELLQDDVYNEEEISSIMEELENDLDETQTLKLRLIEEQKRHPSIARELEKVKRNSLVYSDSGSSGLFADYDSVPSDDSEFIRYSPPGLEQKLEREYDKSTALAQSSLARNEEFEWEHEDGWRGFGSADHIDTLSNDTNKNRSLDNLRKSSSLGRLNHILVERPANNQRERLRKWNVEAFSTNRKESSEQNSESLEEKVALLERKLQDEKHRRKISENEVATLQSQKEELFEELEDTREQLRMSHLNLYYEDDFEEELFFEDEETCEQTGATEKKIRFSPVDSREAAGQQSSSPESNQLRCQTERMRKSRMTGSWRKVNAQFYELDEYENEIKVEMDPRNILDNLRRLKAYTSSLYNDVLSERDELKVLKKRAEKLESI